MMDILETADSSSGEVLGYTGRYDGGPVYLTLLADRHYRIVGFYHALVGADGVTFLTPARPSGYGKPPQLDYSWPVSSGERLYLLYPLLHFVPAVLDRNRVAS